MKMRVNCCNKLLNRYLCDLRVEKIISPLIVDDMFNKKKDSVSSGYYLFNNLFNKKNNDSVSDI